MSTQAAVSTEPPLTPQDFRQPQRGLSHDAVAQMFEQSRKTRQDLYDARLQAVKDAEQVVSAMPGSQELSLDERHRLVLRTAAFLSGDEIPQPGHAAYQE